jgi:galactonate dehydratase
MRITAITPMTCDSGVGGRDWLFVKVETDEGITGWGEGYDWHASPSLAAAIRDVSRDQIGQDPRRIELLNRRQWQNGRSGVPERMKVMAAVELALYDIKGKWLGVPVYELIGGLYRERIPLYWSHFASYRVLDSEALGVDRP